MRRRRAGRASGLIRRLTPRWRLRATSAALVLPILVHLAPMTRLVRWAAPARMRYPDDPTVDDRALAEWVDRVLSRLPPPWRGTCLKRAVVLYHLLYRAGRPVELTIGVRRDAGGALAAHAWLVRDGAPYLEPGREPVERFQVLTTFHPESTP